MSITIKQAFQKLAMVTGAGVKNPWFVIRNLAQTFADVADNIDGGGDKVTVTPITDSGTKIANIKVNNTTSELYTPDVEVTQTITEGTEIAEINGTKIYAPAGGGAWTYQGQFQEVGIVEVPTTAKEILAVGRGMPSGGSAVSHCSILVPTDLISSTMQAFEVSTPSGELIIYISISSGKFRCSMGSATTYTTCKVYYK